MREGHWRDGREYTIAVSENIDAMRFDYAGWNAFEPTPEDDDDLIDVDFIEEDRVWSPAFVWETDTGQARRINSRTLSCFPPLDPPCGPSKPSELRFDSDSSFNWVNGVEGNARPKSRHRRGVNALYGGKRGAFVSEDIDYRVWRALMTLNDESSDSPDRDILIDDNSLP